MLKERGVTFPIIVGSLSLLSAGCSSQISQKLLSEYVDRQDVKKPNVLLIIADDHGYADFSYKGLEDNVRTPNLDQLVASGTNFSNAYATSPICSPSRVGLLTGCYQQRWGNLWYGGPGIQDDSPSMAEHFQELGYQTAYYGKIHYGMENSRSEPQNHGFNHSLTASHGGRTNYLYHSKTAAKRYGIAASEQRMNVLPMKENGVEVDRDGFTTEIFAQEARKFIGQSVEEKSPFFVQLAFNAVHNFTWQLPDEYLKELGLPRTKDWDPEMGTYTSWYDQNIRPNLKHGRAYYLAQLYYMDRQIGETMDYLKELGIEDETLVIYTADNGGSMCNWGLNTPLRGSKYTLYEGGIRVPMIMKWKGVIAEGATHSNLISGMDIMPTVLDFSGRSGSFCDGISFYDNLIEDEPILRDTLFWDTGWQYAVRKGDWKLKVVTSAAISSAMSYEHTEPGYGTALYNLADDISEETDLAKSNPQKVKELKIEYKKWKRSLKNEWQSHQQSNQN